MVRPLTIPECHESFWIEDPVCLDIDDGSLQEEHEHWSHSLSVPKYARWDYTLANRLDSRACREQSWNQGWRRPRTQVHLQARSGGEAV